MIFPWQLQTLGCMTYWVVDTTPVLRCPWKEVIMEECFQGVEKKKLHKLGRLTLNA